MTVGDIRKAFRDLPDEAQVGLFTRHIDDVKAKVELAEIRQGGTWGIIRVNLRSSDPVATATTTTTTTRTEP